jgi:hypothetical protein
LFTLASEQVQAGREDLVRLFRESPLPVNELLVNFPLYARSSVVAKWLYINELYERIVRLPGVVMEFGVWWGANLCLFESLRAVYEPYNYTRKIVGFDTFEGYPEASIEDGSSEHVRVAQYSVANDYTEHLSQLLDYHQRENVMGHIKKYELVPGDAGESIVRYLVDHPETVIALAYFDMQLYAPTKACLEAIAPRLVRGAVIAMDELNSADFPGETAAFDEAIGIGRYRILRSRFLPDRAYALVD